MTRYPRKIEHPLRMAAQVERMCLRVASELSLLILLASAPNASAQDSEAEQAASDARVAHMVDVTGALHKRISESCGQSSGTVQYQGLFMGFDGSGILPTKTLTFAVTGWTGGCADGKRHGRGTLSTREDTSATDSSQKTSVLIKAEGAYVSGKRQGLWCVLDYQRLADGESDPFASVFREVGCRLVASELDITRESDFYKRMPDGRWQQMNADNAPVMPAVFLPAGSVEAESERLIAAATAGKAGLAFRPFAVQSNALDGLIAGTTIGEGQPVSIASIKGKRIALILSTNTIAELERFSVQRQALIDATAQLAGESLTQRNRFIAATRQEVLLQGIATSLRRWSGEVTAVDDLTELSSGKYDYAFVVDWRSLSRLDLLGKFKSYPDLVLVESSNASSSIVAGQALGGFLITPDLKVVWRKTSAGEVQNKIGSCIETRGARTCDQEYLKLLADFYQYQWLEKGGDALQ